jgi:peptidoglycan/xylan/chitin deacetylase (PgdA/CDA1 family)
MSHKAWLRAIAARALPRSVFFSHGLRYGRRKRVALTFDDGPGPMTGAYLDELRRLKVRATFFLIGELAAKQPEAAFAYLRDGHEVGGHGWTHDSFAPMTWLGLGDEIERMTAALPRRAGRPLVRPPRGALSMRALIGLAAAGCVTVLWSLDSDDCRTREAADVEERIHPDRVAPGDVILLHETQSWTLAALPAAVGRLRDAGYELVTVGEMMREETHAGV